MPTCFLLLGWRQMGAEAKRGLRGWTLAYPAGPDWQMRKCRGGEEPGPPEVPASPCCSAGSLPLAGRRLGGEKARRREQERGAEGLEGGAEGGGQQAVGGWGRNKELPISLEASPALGLRGTGEESEGLPASCLSLTVLSPRCLPLSHPPGMSLLGATTERYLFSVSYSWGRQEPQAGAASDSGPYSTAGRKGCQGSGGNQLAIVLRGCPHGLKFTALTKQVLFIKVGVLRHVPLS